MHQAALRLPRPGDVRGTVPLLGGYISGLEEGQRLEVAPGVILAHLNKNEGERIRRDSGGATATARIEFHDYLPRFADFALDGIPGTPQGWAWLERNQAEGERLSRLVDLMTLAVRMPPHHGSVHADVWDGARWKRAGAVIFAYTGRERSNYSAIPLSRLGTWGDLCQKWPSATTRQFDTAMEYYQQSLRDRQSESISRAFISAAISWEVLLGHKSSGEITRTLAQRGAHLTARGTDGVRVYGELKRLYGLRSKLVHDGKSPTFDDLTLLQQFLMAALVRAAAHNATDHAELVVDLDSANFGVAPRIDILHVPDQTWWNYVNFPELCHRPK